MKRKKLFGQPNISNESNSKILDEYLEYTYFRHTTDLPFEASLGGPWRQKIIQSWSLAKRRSGTVGTDNRLVLLSVSVVFLTASFGPMFRERSSSGISETLSFVEISVT